MKLSFLTTFLSIKEFPAIELPDFVLVTGLNGTGKTHLLRALAEHKIGTDISNPGEARYFDWNTLVPNDAGVYDGYTQIKYQHDFFEEVDNLRRHFSELIVDTARRYGITGQLLSDPLALARLNKDDFRYLLGNETAAAEAHEKMRAAVKDVGSNVVGSLADVSRRERLLSIAIRADQLILFLERQHFFDPTSLSSPTNSNLFEQSFAQLFVTYRDFSLTRRLRKLAADEGGLYIPELTSEVGVEGSVSPPWDFVNEAIRTCGLDFEVDKPDEFSFAPYKPRLRKISSNAEMNFSDLSSGEQVLMSVAFCLYQTRGGEKLINYPKLLLFDEIDAPLHPSMIRILLDAITKVLVEKHKIKVIMASHSPSTIALAPENAVYAMKANSPGLYKIKKSEALNLLTVGVPTLALSFDGRRQVFVESQRDAEIYSLLYEVARQSLNSERSLEFIGTGLTGPKGDVHSGCDVVRQLVSQLVDTGNQSVFGLIDWDGGNVPSKRLVVVANKLRDGLENVVLDPLAVAALLVREWPDEALKLGYPKDLTYSKLLHSSAETLQQLVDIIQTHLFGKVRNERIMSRYLGQFELSIEQSYFLTDDHQLEGKLLSAFPKLQSIAKGRSGALMKHIAMTVLRDQPSFLPADVVDAFREILSSESH